MHPLHDAYYNTTITLRHETGRTETIPNVRLVHHDDGDLIVHHRLGDREASERYDALEWTVVSVMETEPPV